MRECRKGQLLQCYFFLKKVKILKDQKGQTSGGDAKDGIQESIQAY